MIPILGKPINYGDYTKAEVHVHVVGWFGQKGHIDMGYNSSSVSTCDNDCELMAARGIKGVNFDYYGPSSMSNVVALRMLAACERSGLQFSICIDAQAIPKGYTGIQADQEYARILNFLNDACFSSGSYLTDNGRPVVLFFGEAPGSNRTSYRALSDNKNMAFVYEGGSGWTAGSDGAFGWVNPVADPTDWNSKAIISFNAAAAAKPTMLAFYPTYPGFDDSMASWGKKRMMSRRLGRTTLDTLALVPASAKRVLLATWDDFEEGTATKYSQG